MSTANESCFQSGYSEAAKGLWPRAYSLFPGAVLYRFVDTSRYAPLMAANGPWWFEFEHYQTIKHFAERNDHSLGYAARLFAAILYEWSEVNGVVRAEVKAPLLAWKGKGKQVTPGAPEKDSRDKNRTPHGFVTGRYAQNVSKMTPLQGGLETYQVYIPGLGHSYSNFDMFLKFVDHQPIRTG